ncbi:PIR protein [Plasmodium malariae]|uniref:PIR protein n=1 Tax=Plasmodium malariae TaxID=5858 RepID=A0A1D3JHN9_PLAMA|nr:PIR protein [Plasmodium malariae]SBT85892.1 PIR protein [Plasmodium malariae]
MTPGVTYVNADSVSLYLNYEQEFNDTAISDTRNDSGSGGNPGQICGKMVKNCPDFTTPCQQIGRYLIEIKQKHHSNSPKRCKYLKYRINSDNNYNNPNLLQIYKEFSSKTENVCKEEIKTIQQESLKNLKELYSYYDNFNKFKGKDEDSGGHICSDINNLYSLYKSNYEKCQKNSDDAFCEELSNFKEAYENKMKTLTPCDGLPITLPTKLLQTLEPEKTDHVFIPSLTTALILLISFTLFFLYKFTPLKSWLHNHLRRKKIIEFNNIAKETRESLQSTQEVINISYDENLHNIGYHPQRET